MEDMKEESLKVGDIIEVTAERLAYGGDAVARHNGLALFIPFAAPGERLSARIVERKSNYARATIERIISPSPLRRDAPCRHFGECGGCQLQHISYEAQLEAKAAFVREALARVGKIEWPQKIEVRHQSEFGYRARAQIKIEPLTSQANPALRIGFNRAGSRSICDITDCPVLTPELEASLKTLRTVANQSERFDLREVEMAAGDNGVAMHPRVAGMKNAELEITARGATYRLSPSIFFQINMLLLEALISEAVENYSGRLAIDLYAGAGLFTIQLARQFERVIGVESDGQSARFARENILANEQTNADVLNVRVEDWIKQFIAKQEKKRFPPPDLILLDPPRAGAANIVNDIAQLKPRYICYVSCDPATLARDLRKLIDSGFELERVTAIDLFPQTYHIETVARLRLQLR